MVETNKTPRIILGTQSFALENTNPKQYDYRVQGSDNLKPFLQKLESFGLHELDTARVYCGGDTELSIGAALASSPSSSSSSAKGRFEISTKIYPIEAGAHSPRKLRELLMDSLRALRVDRVKIFYLHAPDFFTPFEETARAVDELYREGKFEQFGLSNFAAWQVALMHQICLKNGFVLPTVYQGWYNPLMRQVERELIPCLRELGLAFYAYNPVAGGFLTGNYTMDGPVKDGTRFDTKTVLGSYIREQYWHPMFFDAVADLKAIATAHGIPSLLEASLRWLNHHSGLGEKDGLILGANDEVQALEENLRSLHKGPLPKEVVAGFEAAWEKVRAANQTYFRRDFRGDNAEDKQQQEEGLREE